jgi:hypothetical protein
LAEIAAVLPIRGLWEVRGDQLAELDPVTGAGLGPVHQADELRASRGAAALALVGSAAVARREDLAAIRLAPLDQRRLARAAERRAWDQSLSLTAEELCQWRLAALEIWYRHLRQVAQDPAAPVPAAACGRMYALIGDEVGRDAVMATAFARAGHTPRRLALEQGGFELMDPKTSAGLDRDLGDAALDLLGRILANVTPRRRGPGYALGAAWHWWSGGGPAAQEWGRSALDCVNPPDLADLVVMLVRQGIYPRAVQGLRH